MPRFREATDAELAAASARAGRAGAFASGWSWTSAMVDSPAYMRWLRERLEATGRVTFERRRVTSLAEELSAAGAGTLLVNCSGLGARELAHDPAVHAARGETLRVSFPRGAGLLREWIVAVEGEEGGGRGEGGHGNGSVDPAPLRLTYVLPRPTAGVAVVGGTYERGDEATEPREATAAAIWARAARLCPDLLDARVERVAQWAGLRPARDGGLRLGPDAEDARVVHNYGHGGEGHSLHWGCARRVAALVLARHERLCEEDGEVLASRRN